MPRKQEVVVVDRSAYKRERAIEKKLDDAKALLNSTVRSSQTFADAEALMLEAIAVDPGRPDTYFDVALIYGEGFGDRDKMAACLEQFIALAGEDNLELQHAHWVLGERATALWDAHSGDALGPVYAAQAERHLLAALAVSPASFGGFFIPEIEETLGLLATWRGDCEAALRLYRAAADHNHPQPTRLARATSTCLVRLDRPAEALAMLEAMVVELPLRPTIEQFFMELSLAEVLASLDRFEEALAATDRAFEIAEAFAPSWSSGGAASNAELIGIVHRARASVEFERGDWESTAAWYRRALEAEPSRPVNMNNLAWTIALQADFGAPELEEALSLSRQAVALERNIAYLDTLAEILFRMGDVDAALEVIDETISMRPDIVYFGQQREKFLATQAGMPVALGKMTAFRLWQPPEGPGL